MRRVVLFIASIISAFIFSACAPEVTAKQFDDVANELKEIRVQNLATVTSHMDLLRRTIRNLESFKELLNEMERTIADIDSQARQTNRILELLFKKKQKEKVK